MTHDKTLVPGQSTTLIVPADALTQRLDQFIALMLPAHSRTYAKELVKMGCVTINGVPAMRASILIRPNDTIVITLPLVKKRDVELAKLQALAVEVIFEHEHFLILSKPAELVVHQPHRHFESVTLTDWLAHFYPETIAVGQEERPGIVHRLDKGTSGLLIVARTAYGYEQLVKLFKERTIKKTYLALVQDHPEQSGMIDFHIERAALPTKMTHRIGYGREAVTFYKVLEYFDTASLLELKPVTGRTHQLRVHCAAIKHPIIGDDVYGKQSKIIKRPALHAAKLEFEFDGQPYTFHKEPPKDFNEALARLQSKT